MPCNSGLNSMLTRIVILLIFFSFDANATSCLPASVYPARLSEYKFIKSCEPDNACPGYTKWDYLYFSKKMFGYEEMDDFYSIKEKSYLENHCLGVITAGRNKRTNGKDELELYDTVALINTKCPASGAMLHGEFIQQQKPKFDINSCTQEVTGRNYLKVKESGH